MQKSVRISISRAEQVRALCLQTARQAAEEAAMLGLCAEGQLQAALSAIETLDLELPDTE
ncbi:hypothetical protein [Lacimicrobium alkaliphilum]|uniref:Acetyltransferase n=1 Tax=Lacimicrobium alkaliphilum TaxID=1526571 RepID=A0A0U2ZI39_9ALTE|nr:hypothetical protein [Lacimicrobium alkaliphilum]ALS98012.1 hypothetical protein AT746_06860 [Lacimicrobium alkaliphilum]